MSIAFALSFAGPPDVGSITPVLAGISAGAGDVHEQRHKLRTRRSQFAAK
jgi:hypothetical protein